MGEGIEQKLPEMPSKDSRSVTKLEHKILVIDDEEAVVLLLSRTLQSLGFDVVTATSGSEGVSLCASDHFDLVLTDLRMPDMDGLEVIEALRLQNLHVPVVAMTGYTSVESAVEAIKGGAEDYLTKPVGIDRLEFVINKTLESGTGLVNKEGGGEAIGGKSPWVLTTKLPWRDSEGKIVGLLGISGDITERRRLERALIRLERLRVSGELAAGISHNLNNMLTTVLGPAQFLLRKSDDPQVHREAEAILTAGRRARDLVARLNQAARCHPEESMGPVSLNEQIQGIVQMARPRWKDEPEARGVVVEVLTELAETPDIRGNLSELGDVILNLLLNAVEGMPEGGAITITTQAVDAGVQLTVSDTGAGMDEETRRRAFEPFFTTKTDIGSGLGLSTVHGTMTRWGGTVEVDSTPGEGTTFTLWLPAWTGSVVSEETPATPLSQVRPGKLLIVEDDEEVGELLDRLLSESHTVAVVRDGSEALDQFVPGQYDVALIDLGMPGLAGDQVAVRLRRLDPSVATVLITGWVLEQDDVRSRWFDFQIPKPLDDLDEVETVVAKAVELHDSRG